MQPLQKIMICMFVLFSVSALQAGNSATVFAVVQSPLDKNCYTKPFKIGTARKAVKITTNVEDFIPKGFVLAEKSSGDLNKDGLEDCVLIITATKKEHIISDEKYGEINNNRRGIIVLLKTKDSYEVAAKNYTCFPSEFVDGGAYYGPILSVSVENESIYLQFEHGQNGSRIYRFQQLAAGFQLIGYESLSCHDSVAIKKTSIDLLKGEQITETNPNQENGGTKGRDKVYTQVTTQLKNKKPIFLNDILDFDDLHNSLL